MQILKTMQRVPGGMMLIPLLLGAILCSFTPQVPQGDSVTSVVKVLFKDTFTGGLLTGAFPILGVFFVCLGATIDVRATPRILGKGGALLAAKLLTAAAVGLLAKQLLGFGAVGGGIFAGLSVLAIVAAMNDTNGGLYMALMAQFGKKEDAGAYSVMSLESGAFFTMLTLMGTLQAQFPWQAMVGVLLPLVLGMILGNLDRKFREYLAAGVPVLIPFFAFALGCGINLANVWKAGLLGILLGIMVVAITGSVLFLTDRLTGGNGIAGLAAASTAGNAAAVPLAVAKANPLFADAEKMATPMVAASVVVTAILVPLVTAWWARRLQAKGAAAEAPEPVAAG